MTVNSIIESPFTVRKDDLGTVVGFPAEVDARNAPTIRDRLLRLLNEGAGPLIVDLTETRFCDCSGARAIIRAHRRASGLRTGLCVAVPDTGPVHRIAVLTGLMSRVPAGAGVADAYEALRRTA